MGMMRNTEFLVRTPKSNIYIYLRREILKWIFDVYGVAIWPALE
jgi:hypothetical protein